MGARVASDASTQATASASYDLLSDAARGDPYPVLRRFREDRPVTYSDQLGAWLVTSYVDVRNGLVDPAISADRLSPRLLALPDEVQAQLAPMARVLRRWPLMLDEPGHGRLRSPITRALTPAVVSGFRPLIVDTARDMIAAGVGRASMDVIADLAVPLPLYVTSRILGVPEDAVGAMKRCAIDIVDFFGAPPDAYLAKAEIALESIQVAAELLHPLVRARRTHPGEDLVSALVALDGGPVSDEEIVALCLMVVFAGFETTSNLIGNGVLLLLQHPEQLSRVRHDPARLRGAIKEVLRYESPVQRLSRRATADLTLRGERIGEGSLIFLHAGAANRDPATFHEPDRFDVGRRGDRHLAFGHWIHACPGATLAQVEAEIALRELWRAAPDVQLARDAIRWRHNLSVRALESLEVSLS